MSLETDTETVLHSDALDPEFAAAARVLDLIGP